MVGGPAHGPRVDVVQLAACARARGALVTLAILEELLLAMSHRRRDGAVVPCRDEGQPPQNGGDGDNIASGGRLVQTFSKVCMSLQSLRLGDFLQTFCRLFFMKCRLFADFLQTFSVDHLLSCTLLAHFLHTFCSK